MSVGTSDSTVISPITTEAHNLNTTNTSAASRDDRSPATIPTTIPENRQAMYSTTINDELTTAMGTLATICVYERTTAQSAFAQKSDDIYS